MKIFIGGSRSGLTFGKLPDPVISKILDMISKQYTILVGDANGVDKSIQELLSQNQYQKVKVYYSGENIRNRCDMNWDTIKISDSELKGRELQTLKDEQMATDADAGYMIWNDTYTNRFGKKAVSSGTLNNIINLLHKNKTVAVYYIPNKSIYVLNNFNELEDKLLPLTDELTRKKYNELTKNKKGHNHLPLFR